MRAYAGWLFFFFFFQAEDGIRDYKVTGFQTCALPICDANLWCGSLALLYFCAGMVADMPSTWIPILFWIGLVLAVFRTFTIGPLVQAATGLLSQIDARLQEM